MRREPSGATVARMATSPLRMVIELDPGEPIAGRIECEDRPTQPFRGWLELSSRLERLRAAATAEQSPAPTPDEPTDPDPPLGT
jgi:hypothetical protein